MFGTARVNFSDGRAVLRFTHNGVPNGVAFSGPFREIRGDSVFFDAGEPYVDGSGQRRNSNSTLFYRGGGARYVLYNSVAYAAR
jgi:hypothetical protein